MTRNQRLHRTILRALLIGAAALMLAACSLAGEPQPAGPIQTGPQPGQAPSDVPAQLPSASAGQAVYQQNCVQCHGPAGAGNGDAAQQIAQQGGQLPDFTDPALARQFSPQDWYRIITVGNIQKLMPPWSSALTDQQRWDVAYYLYTLSTAPSVIADGQTLYDASFAGQYGDRGQNVGLNDPATVATTSPQQLYDQFVATGGASLSEDQRWAVVAYMQTFGYDASLQSASLEPPTAAATQAPAAESTPGATPEPGQPTEVANAQVGTVSGLVSNGTPGGTLPDGLTVNLHGVAMDANSNITEFMVRSAPVGLDGHYEFTDLPFDNAQSAYVVEIIYNGITFNNGNLVDPANPSLDLPITLYETTSDPSVVTLDALHVVVREHPGALLIVQVYVFSNTGDKVFATDQPVTGGQRGSVAIALPPDAYNISFDQGQLGGRYIELGDRIYDTQEFPPGSQSESVVVTYFLPLSGNSREVSLPLDYTTTQATVLMQSGTKLRSGQLTAAGTQTISGESYDQFSGQNFNPGDTLIFTVQGPSPVTQALPLALGILAGVLVVGGLAYWLIVVRRQAPLPAASAGLPPDEEALIREIAELDRAFEEGRIDRFEYEARRSDLKAAIAERLGGGDS